MSTPAARKAAKLVELASGATLTHDRAYEIQQHILERANDSAINANMMAALISFCHGISYLTDGKQVFASLGDALARLDFERAAHLIGSHPLDKRRRAEEVKLFNAGRFGAEQGRTPLIPRDDAIAVDFVKQWEGFESEAYKDVKGVVTIGYGTTRIRGKRVEMGMTCTREEAEAWLMADMRSAFEAVDKAAHRMNINANQRAALASLTYNIGIHGLRTSTALRRLRAGDVRGCADAMTWWNKSGKPKRVIAGLVNRRAAEKQLFLAPVYAKVPPPPERKRDIVKKDGELQELPRPGDDAVLIGPNERPQSDELKPMWQSKTVWAVATGVFADIGMYIQDADPNMRLMIMAGILGVIGAIRLYDRHRGSS